MRENMPPPYGVPEKYWASLDARARSLYRTIKPMPKSSYSADWPLDSIEESLARIESSVLDAGGSFELVPDFQRGHVWSRSQQISFMESLIRKSTSGRILFNCPGWVDGYVPGDIPENAFCCIDGLQRLTAIRQFLAGEYKVFAGDDCDGFSASDLKGTPFDVSRPSYSVQIAIYQFSSRAELLDFYLRLNAGGTPHAADEIARVRALRDAAIASVEVQD